MPTIEIINPELDKRWDDYIKGHPLGLLYHLSGWKNVIERTFPHIKGVCLAVFENDTIKAALPIYEVKSWLAGHRWVSVPFAQFCDPLVSSAAELLALLRYLDERTGRAAVEIKIMNTTPLFEQLNLGLTHHSQYHYILLDKPPEALQKQFHRTCVRQRISRATNSGIQVKWCEDKNELSIFLRLHAHTRKRLGLPPQPDKFFYHLWDSFHENKQMEIVFARKDNEVIAALLLFKFNKRVTVDISAYNEHFLNCSPTHLLFWETIKSSYQEGYKIYDFGRTGTASNDLIHFKNHWGTQSLDLPSYITPNSQNQHKGIKEFSLKYNLIKQICRISPQPIYQMIGKVVYHHIG